MSSRPFSPFRWMVEHGIAPNLLMLLLLIGGLVFSVLIRKEYMPETTLDSVYVSVYYPGASTSEMENAIAIPVESLMRNINGIKSSNTRISTGYVSVKGVLQADADQQQVLQELQQSVSRITSIPSGADKPKVRIDTRVIDVMELVIHADVDKFTIKRLAEQVRDRIAQSPYVSQVKLRYLPPEEIHIEVPQRILEQYNLSLNDIANRISRNATEQSAGKIKAVGGDIVLSVDERRQWAQEFAKLPIISSKEGDQILLEDIATVKEGFNDRRYLVTYNGQRSARVAVYRVGDEDPSDIADAVKGMMPELLAQMPPGGGISIVDDDASNYQQRLSLLLKNAFFGLLLVLILMSLFLQFKLAFWVVAGIPTAFLGSILFLPFFDVSINMVSMFGFIIALGIVVDDAIIAGENIFSHMQAGKSFKEAAIKGAEEVAKPLTFAILTNVIAFLPLLLLPGRMQLLFGAIPIVVVICFLVSWIEALFILPSHLGHIKKSKPNWFSRQLNRVQLRCDGAMQHFIAKRYLPFMSKQLNWPTLSLSIATALFVVVITYAMSGKMGFGLYPKMDGQWVKASFELPDTAPMSHAVELREALADSAQRMLDENNYHQYVISTRGVITDEYVEFALLLKPSEARPINSHQFRKKWQEHSADLNKLGKLRFSGGRRGSSEMAQSSLTFNLKHGDSAVLVEASHQLSEMLRELEPVSATVNSMEVGKPEWKLQLNERGRALGLTSAELASQMRSALLGARAIRQHRMGNQVTALVRLPLDERASEASIENLPIRIRGGGYVPLSTVASISKVLAPSRIYRIDGQRMEQVGAEIYPDEAIPSITAEALNRFIPQLQTLYPNLQISLAGEQEEIAESVSQLEIGTAFALIGIYILLALAFKSYGQPLLIMAIIPFGAVGAILGHLLLGYSLSVVSLMGMLALSGVVVNDSLILIEYANKRLREGADPKQAILDACGRRFRPIILTTLTTFGGLSPMVFETERQAQFVVPMAVSLGFGILFTTFICLVVLPCLFILFHPKKQETEELQNNAVIL